MKVIERGIQNFEEKDFFSPIRDKASFARLIVCSARQLLLPPVEEIHSTSKLKLIVDKMSRLFFYHGNKYFSIAFPLTVITNSEEGTDITTYSGKKIDFENISAVIAILNSDHFRNYRSLIDFPIEPSSFEESGIYLLEEIMQFEPSYIRYDNDPTNENSKLHPLDHLDINYSQPGAYKLGLPKAISRAYFENLQNINTECCFIID